jgi:glycogen debranching enzyme
MDKQTLTDIAERVLAKNDRDGWTCPSGELYPHQWLWDSCFTAIGLRHINVKRAQTEIRSLLKNQWKNGMIPHIVFSSDTNYHAGPHLWGTTNIPNCPEGIESSGISQPPMLAEAVVRIGKLLNEKERKSWYEETFPGLAAFHEWLYRDRDPNRSGLVVIVHPWESGLDNTPPWMEMLRKHALSSKLRLVTRLGLIRFVDRFRKDTQFVPAEERMATIDLFAVYDLSRRIRKLRYNDQKILKQQKVLLVDLAYNSILIRANRHLADIAGEISQPLPEFTDKAYKQGVSALDRLWDEDTKQYYSLNYKTGKLVKSSSIAGFLPMYAGKLPATRVKALLEQLHNPDTYSTGWPVPSAPLNSPHFKPHCYWQGPTWVNMNWLLINGLRRNGAGDEASKLRRSTIDLVGKNGMYEYFSPLDGEPLGAKEFSWTAALTLDLLKDNN